MPAQWAIISAMRPGQLSVLVLIAAPSVRFGAASAIRELPDDASILRLITAADFDLAEPQGVFDHHAAALPTSRLERFERRRHIVGVIDLLGEHDGVLDADACARSEMGRRRMHRIADEDDAAFRPRPRQQKRFQRPEDDPRAFIQRIAGSPSRSDR